MNTQTSLTSHLPRALKQRAGRTATPQVPAHIRVFGVELNQTERATIRQGLGAKLGKYANSIERVSVRVEDVNGARGGVDKICRIKVVLSGLPSVVYESQATSLNDAINGALAGTQRTVRRSLERRVKKPLKAATSANGRVRPGHELDQEP